MKHDYESITALIIAASDSCAFREHSMRWFLTWGSNIATGECSKCHRTVLLNPNPPPNGIDIGGEALAVNCDRPKVKITVEGGVADYEVTGDVEIELLDYNLIECGACPHGCGELELFEPTPYIPEGAGQVAYEPVMTSEYLYCPHCGWKDE